MSGGANEHDGWREHVDRMLDGEELSGEQTRVLAAALAAPEFRRAFRRRLRLEADLRGWAAQKQGFDVALSRERLLARAALREKERLLGDSFAGARAAASRRLWLRRSAWAVALSTAAATLVLVASGAHPGYPAATLTGDARVLRQGRTIADPHPERGDVLAVGAAGGVLELGGYVRLALAAGTDATLAGASRSEVVVVRGGRVDAEVQSGAGAFSIQTPIGTVAVAGTAFSVTVGPSTTPGLPAVAVTVARGSVACTFDGDTILLLPGQRRAFGGPPKAGETKGVVRAIGAGRVKIETEVGSFEIASVGARSAEDIARLHPGEPVTVSWVRRGKDIAVTRVFGTLVGRVTALGDAWLECTPAGGEPRRFRADWRGGMPDQGGGPDRAVVKLIKEQRLGDDVEITWGLLEGERVFQIKPVGNAPPRKNI